MDVLVLSPLLLGVLLVVNSVDRFRQPAVPNALTRVGMPRFSGTAATLASAAEILLGVGLVALRPPLGMLAAYLVLILLSAYAWVSVGASHRGETCPRAATWSVGMVGISLLGVADSLNLRSPLERLMNPVPLIGAGILAVLAAVFLFGRRAVRELRAQEAAATDLGHPVVSTVGDEPAELASAGH